MILYTDIDQFCCTWLESLIRAGLLPKGDVLCEDIKKINPGTVKKYTQRHWMCGIGGWPHALSLAGWPVDRPVDTASLPCQPFSIAGKQQGEKDDRHIWPTFRQAVSVLKSPTIFGEQVPQAIRLGWLDGIFDDLEAENYACGAIVLPSCSVGSPNIRQRLWWVADSANGRSQIRRPSRNGAIGYGKDEDFGPEASDFRAPDNRLADTEPQHDRARKSGSGRRGEFTDGGSDGGVVQPNSPGPQPWSEAAEAAGYGCSAEPANFWSNSQLIQCRDGKQRRIPIESALFPLAPGLPGRVGLLRGAGNAINPYAAAQFIKAFMEVKP